MTPTPRFHTPRDPSRRTLGGKAAKLAAALGVPLMPWQRMAADVALEVDDRGEFVYHDVVVTVPRQSGKTTMTLALGFHRLLTTPGGKIWYTAQTGQNARERFLQELVPRVRLAMPGATDLKRGAGDTRLMVPSIGSQMRPHPPTDKYLHGEQSDLNLIDEPWAFSEVQGDALMQAIIPTQNTRPNAQTIYLSTMGDASSTWWHNIVDAARSGESPRTAVIDWGLPESEDPTDVEAVIAAHPAIGHTIRPQAIYDAAASMKPHEFARAYANIRTATRVAVFDAQDLAAVLTDGRTIASDSPVAFGVAVSWDRSRAVVAVAGYDQDGTPVAEIVDARPGSSWVPEVLRTLAASWAPQAIMVDARSPAAPIATDPDLADVITAPDARHVAAGTAALIDRIRAHTLTIRPDNEVSSAFDALALRSVGDLGEMLDRKHSAGSIAPVEAIMLALTGLTHSQPMPAPMIWTPQ